MSSLPASRLPPRRGRQDGPPPGRPHQRDPRQLGSEFEVSIGAASEVAVAIGRRSSSSTTAVVALLAMLALAAPVNVEEPAYRKIIISTQY